MDSDGEAWTTIVLVAATGTEYAVGRLAVSAPPDLAVVDAIARIHLLAKRMHLSVRLSNPNHELRALLDFVGLADVIREAEPTGSALEQAREPEGGEQLGVEKVVVAPDPPA